MSPGPTSIIPAAGQQWSAADYARNGRFVADLGAPLLDWLAPQNGERILDLGCGDGVLSERIAASGAQVIGADASEELLAEARTRGIETRLVDGHALNFESEFDAAFSNAALHWMKRDPDAVLRGVARALKPGARFVAEMGGAGNVAWIRGALCSALAARGLDPVKADPWYFPTVADYRSRLEAAGFSVTRIELFDRPTPLPGDVTGWLRTFAQSFLAVVPDSERDTVIAEVREALKAHLRGPGGIWTADYVRLRFRALRN